jgi:hypothetical protein
MTAVEIVDNAVMLAIPGAMDAYLSSPLFWGSLTFSLLVAGVAAFPVNRWLISRGRGHAVAHGHHGGHQAPGPSGHAAHYQRLMDGARHE